MMSGMSEPRIVSLLLTTEFSEKKMLSVPSVTMNGGSLSRVTSRPLIAPIARPHRKPTISARAPGSPAFVARLAMRIEEKTAIAPADRSMPAVRMTSVWPSASTAMTVTCGEHEPEVGRREEPAAEDRERDDREEQDRERAQDRAGVQDVLDAQAQRLGFGCSNPGRARARGWPSLRRTGRRRTRRHLPCGPPGRQGRARPALRPAGRRTVSPSSSAGRRWCPGTRRRSAAGR